MGTYNVEMRDATDPDPLKRTCVTVLNNGNPVQITQPDALVVANVDKTDATCNGSVPALLPSAA